MVTPHHFQSNNHQFLTRSHAVQAFQEYSPKIEAQNLADHPHSFKEILGKEKSERPPEYKSLTGEGNTQLMRRENEGFRPSLPKTAPPKDKNQRGLENYSRGFPPYLPDLDWQSGVFNFPPQEIPMMVKYFFHDDPSVVRIEGPFKLSDGPERWHYCYKQLKTGASIYFRDEGPHNSTALLILGGDYLKLLEPIEKYRIIQFLHQRKFIPRRLDIKVDTPKEDGLLNHLYQRADSEQILGIQKSTVIQGLGKERGNITLYLGSRLSDKFYRCYDTQEKHSVEGDRLELILRSEKVKALWPELVKVSPYRIPDDKFSRMSNDEFAKVWHSFLGNYLFGQITPYDWIDKQANRKVNEVGACSWWLELQEKCYATEPIQIYVGTPVKSPQKMIQWMFRQVSKSLAVLRAGFGRSLFKSFFNLIFECGSSRFNTVDRAMIDLIESEREVWEAVFEFNLAA